MDSSEFSLTMFVDSGGGVCEDRAGQTDQATWVLDGATGLTEDHIESHSSDAVWFVEEIQDELRKQIGTDESLPNIFRRVVEAVRADYEDLASVDPLDKSYRPAGTIALIRSNHDKIEYFVLGDSSVIFEHSSGRITPILGEGPRAEDASAIEAMESLLLEGYSHQEARDMIQPKLIQNRKSMNTAEGYWTLGLDPRAVSKAQIGSFPKEDIETILLFTDGFERIHTLFDVFANWKGLVDFIKTNGGERAIRILRAFEKCDSECRDFPRLSISDDVAIVTASRADKNH